MILLLFSGSQVTYNNTYWIVSSTEPDVWDSYCDGTLVWRMTSA